MARAFSTRPRGLSRDRNVHDGDMTDLLERAITAARSMPPAMQDEVARVLLMLTGEDQPVVQLTPEEDAALAASELAEARGEFATDEEVRFVWAKHGL